MTEMKSQSKDRQLDNKGKEDQMKQKLSRKSSSLISSSSSDRSSSSSVSESKYQKKQLQSSKQVTNETDLSKKSSRRQKKYSSRSRSPSSSSDVRSRSNRKQKKSSKYRNRSRQTSDSYRSRENRRDKYGNNDKYRDRNDRNSRNDRNDRKSSRYRDERDRRDYRDRRDKDNYERRERRGRSRERPRNEMKQMKPQQNNNEQKLGPNQIPMPIEIPMPPIPGQRRKRERSRDALDYYKRNQSNNQSQFWDSFSWVPRINYTPNVSSSALANTKKMRRLMITNIPFEMGISKDDLRDLITRFMTQNYLKDAMNNCPVRDLQINEEDHSVAVQLSSVEETCRMCKLQKIELFKGTINGIIRLGDSCYGNNIVTQAQNAAQAQAAAFAAINVLENKKTAFNMDVNLNKGIEASTLIRVTNAVTPYMASHLTAEQWEEYHEDLLEGFSQYGKVVHHWFVKADQKDICADSGNLFIEYEAQEDAVKAMDQMQGRIYDQRIIKLFYVPRQIYYPNYKKDLTPPAIKAPPKQKKQNPYANVAQLSKSAHIASKPQ